MVVRRQAVRREPIEVEVRGKVYEAKPLPWLEAGALGDEILQQNTTAVNNAVKMYVEGDLPQLEAALVRKLSDWGAVLIKAYPGTKAEEYQPYEAEELFELGKAALEVNHLDSLIQLIDPNSPSLDPIGMNETTGAGDGQKISSIPNSSSEDSPEPQS